MCNTCGCKSAEEWGAEGDDNSPSYATRFDLSRDLGSFILSDMIGYGMEWSPQQQQMVVQSFKNETDYVKWVMNQFNRYAQEMIDNEIIRAEEFGAENERVCDYCEMEAKDMGMTTFPNGLAVCDMCFDEEAEMGAESFEATKGMDTYAQPLEELKIKPTKAKVGILLASIVAGGLWYSNKMKE